MRKILLGIILILIFIGVILSQKSEILSPTGEKKVLQSRIDKYKVVGFLPTYMIGKTREYTNEIDELIFLGIEVDEKGNLIWDSQSKKINNETYLKQKDLIWENGGKNILGIKLFDDEKLDIFLDSEEAQSNLINQLKELFKSDSFDGINVDFEYQRNSTGVLSEKMINFLKKLKENDLGEISLDVLVNTINKGSAEQIGNLMNSVDDLIVMAYDFHRPGVDSAGAVAPIQSVVGDRNIMEVVEKFLDLQVDKEKIVMAYPLYGYEWKTYSNEFEAAVKKDWCQMASWNRVKEIIKEKNIETKWDELSMTPWLVFEEDGEIHQIYYENERSLKIKMDLVSKNQFGGVGFWALGYEGNDKEFWANLIVDGVNQIR